jgi:cytochrome c553
VIARWGQATAAAVVALTSMAVADTGLPPPSRLAETGLDAPGVRTFSPQYPLWTDGAAKRRWISLPPGTAIDGTRLAEWDFPVGTKFWKEFSFGGRKVETRFLWRATSREWMAVSYVWNEEGTEAVLAPADGLAGTADLGNGKQHAIPSRSDCLACHGAARTRPLGFSALQLSDDRDPNAIHGEPLPEGALSLESLVAAGLLRLARPAESVPRPRIATSDPVTRSVLGYLAGNCGSCHSRTGDVPAVTPFLPAEALLTDADAVARALATQTTTWQAPGRDEGTTVIDPQAPDASAMLARMRSRRPSSQMPPLGTAVRDQEAVAAVEKWIASMARTPHGTR